MKIHVISLLFTLGAVEALAMRGPRRDFDRPGRYFGSQEFRGFRGEGLAGESFQGRIRQHEGQRFSRFRGGQGLPGAAPRRFQGRFGGPLSSRFRDRGPQRFERAGLRRSMMMHRGRFDGRSRGDFGRRRFERSHIGRHRRGVTSPVHRAFLRREFRGHPWSWWFRNRPAVVFHYWIKRRPAFFFRHILPIYIREYYVSDDPAANCLKECVNSCYGNGAPGVFEEEVY